MSRAATPLPPLAPFACAPEAVAAVLDVLAARLPGSLVSVTRRDEEDVVRLLDARGGPDLPLRPGDEADDVARLVGARSVVAVELELASGRPAGGLCAAHPAPDRFDDADRDLLAVLGRLLAAELDRAEAFGEMLRREWQLAKRGTVRSQLAVFAADEPTDDAVARLGRTLRAVVRATDLVAPLGGGRFAAVLIGCVSRGDAADFRRRLEGQLGGTGVAIGFEPLDLAVSPEAALEAAEAQLGRDRERRAAPERGILTSLLSSARRR